MRRNLPFIHTWSGKSLCLENPQPNDIHIADIAHALSHLCRFTGHVTFFYSVAEHSVAVSRMVPPECALSALMHDAPEAYLGDVSQPLKTLLPEYRRLESKMWEVIAKKFKIPRILPDCVHFADKAAQLAELDGLIAAKTWAAPLTPMRARRAFLDRFAELRQSFGELLVVSGTKSVGRDVGISGRRQRKHRPPANEQTHDGTKTSKRGRKKHTAKNDGNQTGTNKEQFFHY